MLLHVDEMEKQLKPYETLSENRLGGVRNHLKPFGTILKPFGTIKKTNPIRSNRTGYLVLELTQYVVARPNDKVCIITKLTPFLFAMTERYYWFHFS